LTMVDYVILKDVFIERDIIKIINPSLIKFFDQKI
jgi:hypothetical protein